ncbi:MAG: J domain-containing protein [Oligoflexales bacterium]
MHFDWFEGVRSISSVHYALDSLIDSLEMRRSFSHTLRSHLTSDSQDRVSELSQNIAALKKNIDARLPSLNTRKVPHFFEKNQANLTGPFHQDIKDTPILNPLLVQPEILMLQIERAWRIKQKPCFTTPGCLWYQILELNLALTEIDLLPAPWGSISLKQPKTLHPSLQSSSLDRFLRSIAQELHQAQTLLDSCYWSLHRKTKAFSKESLHKTWPTRIPPQKTVKDNDLELFKFSSLPSINELKRRYYQLARVHHPDIPGGSPEGFQKLQIAYQRLSNKCLKNKGSIRA